MLNADSSQIMMGYAFNDSVNCSNQTVRLQEHPGY